jgi:hypothetical protein
MDRLEAKKVWEEPKLVVHGDVERITQDQNKVLGTSDGFLFMGVAIRNAS